MEITKEMKEVLIKTLIEDVEREYKHLSEKAVLSEGFNRVQLFNQLESKYTIIKDLRSRI